MTDTQQPIYRKRPRLILLDRDGVVNAESPEFIKTEDEWIALPGSLSAIARLQAAQFDVAVCTNQSGVGRGLFSHATLGLIHAKLNAQLVALGGTAVDIFYCPHLPDDDCPCRKPRPDLLLTAMHEHKCTPEQTVFVGDAHRDLVAAANAGCDSILVRSGHGTTTQSKYGDLAAAVFDDLAAVADALTNPPR